MIRSALPALLLFVASLPAAEEFGKLPYATLDQNYERMAGLDRSKVAMRVVVTSKNPAVKPGAIKLTLESKASGTIPLKLSSDGTILDFPRNAALKKENPFLVSNQPKGSLQLTVDVGLPVPGELSFPYARLAEGLDEVNAAVKKQSGALGVFVSKAGSVNFVFGDPAATVTVPAAGGGTTTLKADAGGNVLVTIDPALAKGDGKVTCSAKPRWLGIAK